MYKWVSRECAWEWEVMYGGKVELCVCTCIECREGGRCVPAYIVGL